MRLLAICGVYRAWTHRRRIAMRRRGGEMRIRRPSGRNCKDARRGSGRCCFIQVAVEACFMCNGVAGLQSELLASDRQLAMRQAKSWD